MEGALWVVFLPAKTAIACKPVRGAMNQLLKSQYCNLSSIKIFPNLSLTCCTCKRSQSNSTGFSDWESKSLYLPSFPFHRGNSRKSLLRQPFVLFISHEICFEEICMGFYSRIEKVQIHKNRNDTGIALNTLWCSTSTDQCTRLMSIDVPASTYNFLQLIHARYKLTPNITKPVKLSN